MALCVLSYRAPRSRQIALPMVPRYEKKRKLALLREVPSVARGSAVVGVPVVRSPFAVTDRAPG